MHMSSADAQQLADAAASGDGDAIHRLLAGDVNLAREFTDEG